MRTTNRSCKADPGGPSNLLVGSEDWFEDAGEATQNGSYISERSLLTSSLTSALGSSLLFHESNAFDSLLDQDSTANIFELSLNSFGTFGDFTGTGETSASNFDFEPQIEKVRDEAHHSLAQQRALFKANGFSWNKAKLVHMLSSDSFLIDTEHEGHGVDSNWSLNEDESFAGRDANASRSESILSSDRSRVDLAGDGSDSVLSVDQLGTQSVEGLSLKFAKLETRSKHSQRKMSKEKKRLHSSKRRSSKDSKDNMSDRIST